MVSAHSGFRDDVESSNLGKETQTLATVSPNVTTGAGQGSTSTMATVTMTVCTVSQRETLIPSATDQSIRKTTTATQTTYHQ